MAFSTDSVLFRLVGGVAALMLTATIVAAQDRSPVEYFRDGYPDSGIEALRQLDKNSRTGALSVALDALPKGYTLTAKQITDIMTLCDVKLPPTEEAKLLNNFKVSMLTMKDDELLNAIIKGAGAYGGQTPAGKANAFALFERTGLMEMQAPFIADWQNINVDSPDFVKIFDFHIKRATASGREPDQTRCWQIISKVLGSPKSPAILKTRAEETFVQLFPKLPEKTTEPLLDVIFKDPALASRTYNRLLSQTAAAANVAVLPASSGAERFPWLPQYRALMRMSTRAVALPNNTVGWAYSERQQHLRRAAQIWIDAVRKIITANDEKLRRIRQPYNSEPLHQDLLTIENAEQLLKVSPTGAFASMLGKIGMSYAFQEPRMNLLSITEDFETAVGLLKEEQLAGRQLTVLTNQMNSLLDKMAQTLNPNYNRPKNDNNRYGYNVPVRHAISMTRLRQKSNLQKFRNVLSELRKMGLNPTPEKLLSVFEAIHSKAEVYQYDEIVSTFGDPAKMDEKTIFTLGAQMKQKLAGEWAEEATQLEALTNRSPTETEALTLQGYTVLDSLLQAAQSGEVGNRYLIHALRGAVLYQWADYLTSKSAPAIVAEEKRSLGLQSFHKAAAAYNAMVPDLYTTQYSTVLYEFWFDAFMLAGAGKYQVKDRPNIYAIRAEIEKLPSDAAKAHLELLAGKFMARLAKQTAGSRPVFLQAALKVVDGTEVAEGFKRRLEYYRSLVNEAKLIVEPDMTDGRVANDIIGLRFSLLHTPELGRESGGFSRYLMFANNPNAYIINAMYGRNAETSIANRDELEKNFTESLTPSFEVLSMAFCDPKTEPILQSNGWVSLPLGYALVKPKTDIIDAVPPVKMVLEFNDDNQLVHLPVESAPVSVRLADPKTLPIPPDAVATQRANFRNLSKGGEATVEITVKGNGLIGDIETLFEIPEWTGFKVLTPEDGGVQLNEVSADSTAMTVSFERTWIYNLKPEDPDNLPLKLTLAKPKSGVKLTNFYTHDVNFVECGSECQVRDASGIEHLDTIYFLGMTLKQIILSLIVGLAAVLGIYFGWRKFRCRPTEETITLHVPKTPGPFPLLRYLRELIDSGLVKDDDAMTRLQADIATIESTWFAQDVGGREEELQAIADRWSHME